MKFLLLFFSISAYAGLTITGGSGGDTSSSSSSSADNALAIFDGTDGKTLQYITGAPLLDATGNIVMQDTAGSSTSCYIGADTTGDCTGFYFGSGGPTSSHGMAFNGTNVFDNNATSLNFRIRTYFPQAACSAPGLGKVGDINTGFCASAPDELEIATSGVSRVKVSDTYTETSNVGYNSNTTNPIWTSPDGTCSRCGPDNSDNWACVSVTCP